MNVEQQLAESFRTVMGGVCTPVSVITAMDHDGPHGTTVSAFASLSMSPPMVLVCLDRTSNLLATITQTMSFGVNILSSRQASLASQFARKDVDKFHGVEWTASHALPRLVGSSGWVACTVDGFADGGDHLVLMGSVAAADHAASEPLTYHARSFGTHAQLPQRPESSWCGEDWWTAALMPEISSVRGQ